MLTFFSQLSQHLTELLLLLLVPSIKWRFFLLSLLFLWAAFNSLWLETRCGHAQNQEISSTKCDTESEFESRVKKYGEILKVECMYWQIQFRFYGAMFCRFVSIEWAGINGTRWASYFSIYTQIYAPFIFFLLFSPTIPRNKYSGWLALMLSNELLRVLHTHILFSFFFIYSNVSPQ